MTTTSQEPNSTTPPAASQDTTRDLGRRLAWVCGTFSVLMAILLVINYLHGRTADPIQSKELADLKAALVKAPRDEKLKEQIRSLDLDIRQKYDRHMALGHTGAWLLGVGLIGFLVSIKTATARTKLPRPAKRVFSLDADTAAILRQSGAVAGIAVLVAGGALLWGSSSPTLLVAKTAASSETSAENTPSGTVEGNKASVASTPTSTPLSPFPSPEEIRTNWTRFRGPNGDGISIFTNAPIAWDAQSGDGIRWKVKVPLSNPNSPVIWGNRLFLTGANSQKREVYCYEASSGKLLWQKAVANIPGTDPEPPAVTEDPGGFAAATAAVDGRRVYAIFANGDVAAFDFAGNQVWAINLGKPDNSYGLASSLVLYKDKLLVLFDQGAAKDKKSKLLAFDTATGTKAWETEPRPVPNSWATPVIFSAADKEQIVTSGNPWVISYDPASGKEFWRAQVLYGEVTPSPIFGAGLVFTAMDGEKLSAIKPDGTGDVTKTHSAWSADEGLPEIVSPLCDGKRVYVTSTSGAVTCYEAQTGKRLWAKEFEVPFKSSPGMSGDRIYHFNDQGTCIIFKAADEYQEVAMPKLAEEVQASPAFSDGCLYIRGKTNLFCLGPK